MLNELIFVHIDVMSLNGSEGASRPSVASIKDVESRRSSVHPEELNQRPRYEICSLDEHGGREDGLLECGLIPGNCLPCLAATVPSVEKRRSLSSSPPSIRKKATHKLSFKWKDGHPNASICEYFYISYGIYISVTVNC